MELLRSRILESSAPIVPPAPFDVRSVPAFNLSEWKQDETQRTLRTRLRNCREKLTNVVIATNSFLFPLDCDDPFSDSMGTYWLSLPEIKTYGDDTCRGKTADTYYGSTGIAWGMWLLKDVVETHSMSDTFKSIAIKNLHRSLSKIKNIHTSIALHPDYAYNDHTPYPLHTPYSVGFAASQSCVLAIGCIIFHDQGQTNESQDLLNRFVANQAQVFLPNRQNHDIEDGTGGYLSLCLLLLKRGIELDKKLVLRLFLRMINSGSMISENWMTWPFPTLDRSNIFINDKGSSLIRPVSYLQSVVRSFFKGNKPKCFGFANGDAGCLFILMSAFQFLDSKRMFEADDHESHLSLITCSVRFFVDSYLDQGANVDPNFPSSWANGDSGICLMLTKAFEIFEDKEYIKRAMKTIANRVIFNNKSLKPPNPQIEMANGVAGNVLVLACAFRVTREESFLYGAHLLANGLCEYLSRHEETHLINFPIGLLKGLTGPLLSVSVLLAEDPLLFEFPFFS